jgi:hypothetical protein
VRLLTFFANGGYELDLTKKGTEYIYHALSIERARAVVLTRLLAEPKRALLT